jgi:CDGSH-type Zn-finger protein
MPPCTIIVNANGALRISGDFELVDSEGNRYGLGGRTSIALCRCGGSKRKPFCDGAHNTCGFRHDGSAVNLPAWPA